jgi:hypothetical protein
VNIVPIPFFPICSVAHLAVWQWNVRKRHKI